MILETETAIYALDHFRDQSTGQAGHSGADPAPFLFEFITEFARIRVQHLVAMKLKRMPREKPIDVENSRHTLRAVVASLRMDGEAIPFEILAPLEVGKPAQFLLQSRQRDRRWNAPPPLPLRCC